jgi:uncharacterized protein YkwD
MRFSSGRLAAVLFLAVGCAGAMSANKRSPGVIENGAFRPTRPANPNYGPDPSLACPEKGVNGVLQDNLDDAAKKSGKPAAQPDGRLCAFADTLLGWEKEETPPQGLLSFVSSYFGLPAPVRRIVIQNIDTEEHRDNPGAEYKDVAERLTDTLVNFASTAVQPRYGLYTQRVKKAKGVQTKVVIAMLDQSVELDPFPRRMELGAQSTLSGRLLGALENPKVQYTDLSGKLEVPAIPEGKSFKVDIKCGDKPGVIPIQILGGEKGAQTQLANFPLACGTALATSAPLVEPPKGPVDPAQAEAKVLELMNADRTAAGLKPLAGEKELANVARGLSERRAKGLSISSADLAEGLKTAGISSPLVLESAAQATSAEEAYERFTSNPTDRSYSLNKDITHVGIGVTKGPELGGRPSIIVTELFVKQLPPMDVKALRAKLHTEVARKRADARAPALAKDPMLEELAQKMAEEMAAAHGNLPKARQSELEAPLYKAFRTVNILGGIKSDPLEFAEEPGVVGAAKVIGIGVAQGTSTQFGKNSAFVVIFIGARR